MAFQKGWKRYIKKYQCPRKTKVVKLTRIGHPPEGNFKVKCDSKYIGTLYTGSEREGIAVFHGRKGFRGRGLFG